MEACQLSQQLASSLQRLRRALLVTVLLAASTHRVTAKPNAWSHHHRTITRKIRIARPEHLSHAQRASTVNRVAGMTAASDQEQLQEFPSKLLLDESSSDTDHATLANTYHAVTATQTASNQALQGSPISASGGGVAAEARASDRSSYGSSDTSASQDEGAAAPQSSIAAGLLGRGTTRVVTGAIGQVQESIEAASDSAPAPAPAPIGIGDDDREVELLAPFPVEFMGPAPGLAPAPAPAPNSVDYGLGRGTGTGNDILGIQLPSAAHVSLSPPPPLKPPPIHSYDFPDYDWPPPPPWNSSGGGGGGMSNSGDSGKDSRSTIRYYGGPVMAEPINVYLLFYGRWYAHSCGIRVLSNLIKSLSDNSVRGGDVATGVDWWRTNIKYYQTNGRHVSRKVTLAGVHHDWFSIGPSLAGAHGRNSVWTVLRRSLKLGKLPVDRNGAYMVLTSADVTVGARGRGFCRAYCGWHTYERFGDVRIKYGFAGNAVKQCPQTTCNMHMSKRRRSSNGKGRPATPSPNGCYGPDGMASTVLHEVAEIASDPYLNAWKTKHGQENADLCYRRYNVGTDWSHGSKYNIAGSGNTKFLVQTNFDLDTQKCVIKS